MSTANTKKWSSVRVQQQQQQHHTGSSGVGGKVMEDAAISAARIREHKASPEVEIPASKDFESQEATDTLSNLAHSAESHKYELIGKPVVQSHQTTQEFHEKFLKDLQATQK